MWPPGGDPDVFCCTAALLLSLLADCQGRLPFSLSNLWQIICLKSSSCQTPVRRRRLRGPTSWLAPVLPLFQHHHGAAVREREGRGRLFIRGVQRREHLWILKKTKNKKKNGKSVTPTPTLIQSQPTLGPWRKPGEAPQSSSDVKVPERRTDGSPDWKTIRERTGVFVRAHDAPFL